MSEPTVDVSRFGTARSRAAVADDRVRDAARRLAAARAERAALASSGAPARRVAAADAAVTRLVAEHERRAAERNRFLDDITDLQREVVGRLDPSVLVTTLDGALPIALLPVRIETRFFDSGRELRIRVYPDQVHLDAHEPELTDAEVEAGQRYWRARWGGGTERTRTAWQELAGTIEPRRARWVADVLTPTNLGDETVAGTPPAFPERPRKAGPWTRAAHATALPDRWLAVGYRGGAELFRRWSQQPVPDVLATTPTPDPSADPDEPVDIDPGEPPADEPMRWAVDYDAALANGMAVTVTDRHLPSGQSLAGGLDRLVVLGVDWTMAPQDAAGRLAGLLSAHGATDGLAFLAQGTPSNNTGATRSGLSTARAALVDDLDPAAAPRGLPAHAAGPRLAAALGLPTDQLDGVPRSGLLEARTASLLADVLWSATLGHYLELFAPLVGDRGAGLTRDHVVRWLHPAGPFATLRVGRQPYGVLPVVARRRFEPDRRGGFEEHLSSVLGRLRSVWDDAATRVPRMGRSGDVDTDLLELLQRTPLASVARFRTVVPPGSVADTKGFAEHAPAQAWLWALWRRYLAWSTSPELALYVTDPKDHPLPVPFVQPTAPGPGPLAPNYLAEIAATARARGRDRLAELTDAASLLQALVAHAAAEEIDTAITSIFLGHAGPTAALETAARTLRVREMYGVVPGSGTVVGTERLDRRSVTVSTPKQLAHLVLPDLTGAATLADLVTDLVTSRPERPEVRTLAGFLRSLDELAGRPGEEIDRAFRGFLDATSHRLDAWVTSLATRRLDAVRARRPEGVHLGGYGWVDELHPDRTPDSLGYVHAPSLPHAATAALLRSGHLAHRDDEHETLDLQLTSDRVQRALPVIEGAAAGQPIAALLGYRIERGLRESDDRLTRYVLPARRFAPLRPSDGPTGTGPQEAIGARDVVDGVRLLEAWRDDRGLVLSRLGVPADHGPQVAAVLDDVAATWDAVGDVLVAESVHQTVLGNYERAGAALAAIDKQQRPPEPEVVRTPRTGTTYTQKVLVAVGTGRTRPPWRGLQDARSAAAPALDAWAAAMLPDPARVRLWGVVTAGGDRTVRSVTAADLGTSALGLVLATATGASAGASELESRVAVALTDGVELGEDDRLELLDGRPPEMPADPGEVNLGALRVLLTWMRELLGSARPLVGEDLVLPGGDRASGVDVAALEVNADVAVSALRTAADAVAALRADETANAARLRQTLAAAAELGIAEAVPRVASGGSTAARAALRAQVPAVLDELGRRASRLDGVSPPSAPADGTAAAEAAVVRYHGDRLRAVFGDGFPVVPAVRLDGVADVAGLRASLGDAAATTGGDPTAPRAWLDRMALVRPGTDRLARVLQAAELLGSDGAGADAVRVAQLPHEPGGRWLALPFAPGTPAAAAELALAVHAAADLDLDRPVVGLVCDEWVETIPGEHETTGLTFHYDAPGARAPQAILLAVPPRLSLRTWDLDTVLETVLEAAALSRIRGVAPKDLRWVGGALPMVYLPDNFTGDRPRVDVSGILQRYAADIAHASVLGKGWSL